MYAVPKIPGVSLEVYKQDRQLMPESDGYVGKLFSGFATILAVIDPKADLTIGIFRDGQDHYMVQKDWLNNPVTVAQQQAHEMYLARRSFASGTKVFGVKVPLRVNEREGFNFVSYPENMLMLAQYCPGVGTPIIVWKVALVSQDGDFFLTVQEAYDVRLYVDGEGKLHIPRLEGHKQLERLLIDNAPAETLRYPLDAFQRQSEHDYPVDGLKANEGIVERWYAARNMGCVLTAKGSARVHWTDVPSRPRLRYLVAGERVRIAALSEPPRNPRTEWRKVRKSRFELQASGIQLK